MLLDHSPSIVSLSALLDRSEFGNRFLDPTISDLNSLPLRYDAALTCQIIDTLTVPYERQNNGKHVGESRVILVLI